MNIEFKKMKYKIVILFFVLLLTACNRTGNAPSHREALAKVKDRVLTRDEIETQISKGLSPEDSLLRAESLIKKRIIELLTDEVAYKNLGDEKAEIDRLVNEYRRSLIRLRYQERIVNDKVSVSIRESDQMAYYEANKEQFVLNENLIKGLFIKVPVKAPGLDNIRNWYVSKNPESLEKIEKYCLQNALIYDYFFDNWVEFNEVSEKIPHRFSNPAHYLKANTHFEVSDSDYVYLLAISDRLLVGSTAPYEYVKPQIHNILVNKQKIDYLRDFGEKLYTDAVKNGTVKFISE